MPRFHARTALVALSVLLPTTLVHAQCVENPRKVELDKNNVTRLKSYLCRIGQGPNEIAIKVEVHRFTNVPAGLIVENLSSRMLKRTIGSPKVIANDVFKVYADLLKRFGQTSEPRPNTDLTIGTTFALNNHREAGEGISQDDVVAAKKVRTLYELFSSDSTPLSYPAAQEISALKSKKLPAGLNFYYRVACKDDADGPPKEECKNFEDPKKIFWRDMTLQDVVNYSDNLKSYNAILEIDKQEPLKTPLSRELKLAQHMAGASWPAGFMTLFGKSATVDCGDDIPPEGAYDFSYYRRPVVLETILIENASKRRIEIGGLFGTQSADTGLRLAEPAKGATATLLGAMAEALAPGQRLLVPTGIVFEANDSLESEFRFPVTAKQLHQQHGAGEFGKDAPGFGAPDLKDFFFGPQFDVSGIMVNRNRVDLGKPLSNFADLTLSFMEGSCPYLQSWDAKARDWLEHGKVLHKASDRRREYTETMTFPGFRPRFRLEEREPELASIDHVELEIALKDGSSLTLAVDHARLAARDGDYLRLSWGDAVEFEFALPVGLPEKHIVESRLKVTGYYERYSSLLAKQDQAPSQNRSQLGRPRAMAAACPAPAISRPASFAN
jgi:hypothetical protein